MELSYILLLCGFTYLSLSDVYCTDGAGYEFFPCGESDSLSFSRCLLLEAEVDKECDCQSLCKDDDRCVFVVYNPDTKTCRLYDHNKEEMETTGWKCARIVDCGDPDFGDGVDANYNSTTFGSVAEIECTLGYFSTTDDIQSVCQGSGQWSDPTGLCEVVDCGDPDFGDGVDANYNTTTYGSVAEIIIKCALGYFSTKDDIQSECQDSGQWSDLTGVCEEIPWLEGTKELPDSDAGLECRNVISEPALIKYRYVYATCAEDEIMTACSTTNPETEPDGPGISSSMCYTTTGSKFVVGGRAVARCCKLPGLRCEYFRNVKTTASVSCYKNFQLLDCTCKRYDFSPGPCPMLMNGNNCVLVDLEAYSYAVCCDLGDYSCYRKDVTGLGIRCDVAGEVMTSCSGYSNDYGIFGSLIKNVTGTDECQLDPGPGDISQIYGYITCCKRDQ